jgi:5'-methylthioadenosine phosphorylase
MSKTIIGLIGGTGLGKALLAEVRGEEHRLETPFGQPSGPIVRGVWEGMEVAFLGRHGRGHMFGPTAIPYRANIYALKMLGVTHIIASGATGSLREEIRPRDLVVPDQVIDKTTRRAGSFFDEPGVVAHVEFAEPFCPRVRELLLSGADGMDVNVHDGGTYVCMEGPAFSTIAESRMHRSWGGDLIGMTVMPEAKLAREAEICYGLVALPTDYDCWRAHDPGVSKQALLAEILHNVEEGTARCVDLIRRTLRLMVGNPVLECGCQRALEAAIWSDRALTGEARNRLGILISKYIK